jgi:hypothetical protein
MYACVAFRHCIFTYKSLNLSRFDLGGNRQVMDMNRLGLPVAIVFCVKSALVSI